MFQVMKNERKKQNKGVNEQTFRRDIMRFPDVSCDPCDNGECGLCENPICMCNHGFPEEEPNDDITRFQERYA